MSISGNLGMLSRTFYYDTGRANRVQALATQYQSGATGRFGAATSRGMISERSRRNQIDAVRDGG
jgi:hypothetical protein